MSLENTEYTAASNERLAELAAKGDELASAELVSRFVVSVNKRAESFSGAVPEDLVQEGLLALLNATATFDSQRDASFYTYAMACVKNRMISAYKKQSFVYEELSGEHGDENSTENNPEAVVLEKENVNELYKKINSSLSELEREVFELYLRSNSYERIADKLGITVKSADNAMQRVRRKLKRVLK